MRKLWLDRCEPGWVLPFLLLRTTCDGGFLLRLPIWISWTCCIHRSSRELTHNVTKAWFEHFWHLTAVILTSSNHEARGVVFTPSASDLLPWEITSDLSVTLLNTGPIIWNKLRPALSYVSQSYGDFILPDNSHHTALISCCMQLSTPFFLSLDPVFSVLFVKRLQIQYGKQQARFMLYTQHFIVIFLVFF
jgi:hypothetical protein